MARRSPDGEARLDLVLTIADPENPTVAELNAGVPLHHDSTGWNFPESGQTIDTSDMGSSFNKTDAGTYGGDAGTFDGYVFAEDSEDFSDAWTALPRLTRGFIVERDQGGEDEAYAAADVVSIYPIVVSARSKQPAQRNTPRSFQATLGIRGEPTHEVAVVAGA